MGIRSISYFGVRGQRLDDAVRDARTCLQGWDAAAHGVTSWAVHSGSHSNIMVVMDMTSADTAQADNDSERASEQVKRLLWKSPSSKYWRERQRELSLF